MATIKIKFALERETKGAVRFQEVDGKGAALDIADGAQIGTLYVRKSALPGGVIPKSLDVEVKINA